MVEPKGCVRLMMCLW